MSAKPQTRRPVSARLARRETRRSGEVERVGRLGKTNRMKTKLLVMLSLVLGAVSTGWASPKEDVEKVVESFYARYYREYLGKPAKGGADKNLLRWVNANPFVSDDFKKALRKAVVDARKEDPEMGLDYDPILDAQDYPEKGYRARRTQISGNKATVAMEGIDAPDFKVSVELVSLQGNWRINGIGQINRDAK